MDYNKFTVMGRLTSDPVLEYVGENNTAVTKFTVAASSGRKKEKKYEKNVFMPVVVWGKQGENCQKYLVKGQEVLVEGPLETDTWDSENGKRSKTSLIAREVHFGNKPKSDASPTEEGEFENEPEAEEVPF